MEDPKNKLSHRFTFISGQKWDNINVAAIPGEKLVKITQEGNLLSLGLPTSTESKLNPVTFTPLSFILTQIVNRW